MANFTASFRNIEVSIKRLWALSTVHIFGSFKSGLALFNSDIDIIIDYCS